MQCLHIAEDSSSRRGLQGTELSYLRLGLEPAHSEPEPKVCGLERLENIADQLLEACLYVTHTQLKINKKPKQVS